jgi:hypothetical protein
MGMTKGRKRPRELRAAGLQSRPEFVSNQKQGTGGADGGLAFTRTAFAQHGEHPLERERYDRTRIPETSAQGEDFRVAQAPEASRKTRFRVSFTAPRSFRRRMFLARLPEMLPDA